MRFKFSYNLTIFQQSRIIYRRLQAVVLTFRHSSEVKQIHTHKAHPIKCLFLNKPLAKFTSPSPPLFDQENAAKKYQLVITMVIFTYICVFRLSILVSVGPQKYEKVIASES